MTSTPIPHPRPPTAPTLASPSFQSFQELPHGVGPKPRMSPFLSAPVFIFFFLGKLRSKTPLMPLTRTSFTLKDLGETQGHKHCRGNDVPGQQHVGCSCLINGCERQRLGAALKRMQVCVTVRGVRGWGLE